MSLGPTLRELSTAELSQRLAAQGCSAEAAEAFGSLLSHCGAALGRQGAGPAQRVSAWVVPGRIEVLGKHTDYAGGRSLLAAADRGFAMLALPRADHRVTVTDARRGGRIRFPMHAGLAPARGWVNYPMTVARRLARNFGTRAGADIVIASNLPSAAGMSSSSALMIAVFLGLADVNRLDATSVYQSHLRSRERLAAYLATMENGQSFGPLRGDRGVGTQGGSQDHTAILCARPGRLVQYSFAPVRFEGEVPLPAGYRFAIGASGVHADKTGSALARYNRAAEQMRRAAELWRAATGRSDATLGALLEVDPSAAERVRSALRAADAAEPGSRALLARFDQFVAESREIIPAAARALAAGDLQGFGSLVDRSQRLAESALGNQVEETIHLARAARDHGAVAASAFGAGFGGSVWALVEESRMEEFLERWRAAYVARFPERAPDQPGAATFFSTRAGPPALRVS